MIRKSPTNPPAPATPAQDMVELQEKIDQLKAAVEKYEASRQKRRVWMREYMRGYKARAKAETLASQGAKG
jgi:hypothetical protein